jgi:hypothetical protein
MAPTVAGAAAREAVECILPSSLPEDPLKKCIPVAGGVVGNEVGKR